MPLCSEILAPTPPMGWNSWNAFGVNIHEALIRETADRMVSTGLRDAGYVYLNLDDGWQAGRGPDGTIRPDPEKFPSGIKTLADFVHSKGLKFGLYTCAGSKTCAKLPGSLGYEKKDMATYAAWGVDYVKVDWCFTEGLDSKTQYALFRDGIREAGRPMVLSICNWGVDAPWTWGREVGQLWRTSGDLVDCWDCTLDWGGRGVIQTLDSQIGLEGYAGPGGWNDPDMLQVGNKNLTFEEAKSHFGLWCMLAAPLLAGCDLRAWTPEVHGILLNPEVLAVDQDPAGRQGRRAVELDGGREVWIKPLSEPGTFAVCLFNRSAAGAEVEVEWSLLGFGGEVRVRDLWERKDLRVPRGSYTRVLPPHGTALWKVWSMEA